jgi:hypothetical protein
VCDGEIAGRDRRNAQIVSVSNPIAWAICATLCPSSFMALASVSPVRVTLSAFGSSFEAASDFAGFFEPDGVGTGGVANVSLISSIFMKYPFNIIQETGVEKALSSF